MDIVDMTKKKRKRISGSGFKNVPVLKLGKTERLLPSAIFSLLNNTANYIVQEMTGCDI